MERLIEINKNEREKSPSHMAQKQKPASRHVCRTESTMEEKWNQPTGTLNQSEGTDEVFLVNDKGQNPGILS